MTSTIRRLGFAEGIVEKSFASLLARTREEVQANNGLLSDRMQASVVTFSPVTYERESSLNIGRLEAHAYRLTRAGSRGVARQGSFAKEVQHDFSTRPKICPPCKYSQCDSLFRVVYISPGEFTFDSDALPLLLQNSSTCAFFHRRCCPSSLTFKHTPSMQPSDRVARNGTSRTGQRFLSGSLLLIHRL